MATPTYDGQGNLLFWAPITLTDTTATQIVAGVAGLKIRVSNAILAAGAATNVEFRSNTTVVIPGDTTVGGGIPLGGAGGGFLYDGGQNGWLMETAAGEALFMKSSAATRVVGSLNYKLVPA